MLPSGTDSVPGEPHGKMGKDSPKITQKLGQWRRFTPRHRHSSYNLSLLHPKEKQVCLISLPFYTRKGKSEDTEFTFTTSQDLPAWASLRPKDRLHSKSPNSTWVSGRAREGMLDWLSWGDQKKLRRTWIKADHQGHLVTDCQKIDPMFYLNRPYLPFGWTLSWSLWIQNSSASLKLFLWISG